MLQPKRTKYRRQQKNNLKGNAQRGNQLAFGSFGIKTLDSGAACSPTSLTLASLPMSEWVKVRVIRKVG